MSLSVRCAVKNIENCSENLRVKNIKKKYRVPTIRFRPLWCGIKTGRSGVSSGLTKASIRYATGSYGWNILKKWSVVGSLKSSPSASIRWRKIEIRFNYWLLSKQKTSKIDNYQCHELSQTFRLASPMQRNVSVENLFEDMKYTAGRCQHVRLYSWFVVSSAALTGAWCV